MHVVWFKRDLRIEDHEPLIEAIQRANGQAICCLYVYEPSLLESPEWDQSHSQFIDECLTELAGAIHQRGGQLSLRHGDVCTALADLHREHSISALFSHEESGNALTYQRDIAVGAWCSQHNIPWHEFQQTGVIRRLRDRDGWSKRWNMTMKRPPLPAPAAIKTHVVAATLQNFYIKSCVIYL